MAALLATTLACLLGATGASPIAWVVESETYATHVQRAATGWSVQWCGANGSRCTQGMADVGAVVGRADAIDLTSLPGLRLVQSASWYPVDGAAVPARVPITNFDIWPDPWYQPYSVSNIGEFAVAAIFDDTYRLRAHAGAFLGCAFAADSPARCSAASTATNHTTVSALTVGVLGYGRIGQQVAMRMAALGADVVATRRHGPFEPAPKGLRWLSADNDRLLRVADVVVVCVPGAAHGLLNATALALVKDDALLVPISAGPVDFGALEAALVARPSLRAVLDVWPDGCWQDDGARCGPPLGRRDWPGSPRLASLPNVVALPGLAMRDAKFWEASAILAASNLRALAEGRPLQHVVRNASTVGVGSPA